MRENVLFRPARDIEQGARRKEVEARLGEADAILPRQPLVELFLERMEVANVARRILALGVAEVGGPPVAGLLLLRQVDVQQLLDQVLEAVPICIGAHQT